MTGLLGLFQLLLISFISLDEYKRKSPAVFLWAMLLIIFAIPHSIVSCMEFTVYDKWVYQKASYFVVLFSVFYILSRSIYRKKIRYNIYTSIKRSEKGELILKSLFLILCFSVFIKLYALYKVSGSLMNTSWSSFGEVNESLSYFSIFNILPILFYPSSACLFIAILLRKKVYIILSFFVLLLGVIITRNRIEILPILVTFIWLFLLKGKKITLILVFKIVALSVFSIYCVYALQMFRYAGTVNNFIDDFSFSSFNDKIFEKINSGGGELGLREAFYYFISRDNEFPGFGEGHTYVRILMVFIPTQWSLGLKPDDFAITMGAAWNPGSIGFSMHPTLFGDCYANFGFWGVLLGVFWALLVNIIDYVIIKSKRYIQASLMIASSCCFIIIGRGAVYNSYIWLFYGIIFVKILSVSFFKIKSHIKI